MKEKIKILFINATDTSKRRLSYPPLGIGYLVSSLRKRFGHKIECKIVLSDVEKNIIEFKPDIVGISSITETYNIAMEHAKTAKYYDLPVIIGGCHISTVPNSLTENMDIGVMVEGEVAICELVDLFMRTSSFDDKGLEKIDGIIYRGQSGTIQMTKRRELIRPLDRIEPPARDILKVGQDTHIFSSRGCPYKCVFCASTRFWAGVRYFSAEYVFNEIKHLIEEYNVRHIHFYDDLFIANKERIKKIVALLEKNNYLGKIAFSCYARANLIDESIVQLLKKMGVRKISVGIESGCEKTLKYLKGGSVTVEDNKNAIKIIKKYGMDVDGGFIIGSPKESREDILKTLEFIKKNRMDGFSIGLLVPYPGTPVWEYAKSKGLVNDDMDWSMSGMNFAYGFNTIILSETLSRKELRKLFNMFLMEQRKKKFFTLIKNGLKRPFEILTYLKKYNIIRCKK